MSIAFVFPGQGSQFVSMGRDIYETSPSVSHSFYERANQALGFDLKALMFDGPERRGEASPGFRICASC